MLTRALLLTANLVASSTFSLEGLLEKQCYEYFFCCINNRLKSHNEFFQG